MSKILKKERGITLIALVITIIVLLILASVTIATLTGENGLLNKAKNAREETDKKTATEAINFKITNVQMSKYAEVQRMPTLKELADNFCDDNDFEKVIEKTETASLTKISNENPTAIIAKLKAYPYEFEIDKDLKLASINGIQLASNQAPEGYILPSGTYEITHNGEYNIAQYEKVNVHIGSSEYISLVDFNISKDDGLGNIEITATATTSDQSKIIGYHFFILDNSNSSVIKHAVSSTTKANFEGLLQGTSYKAYVVAYDIYNNAVQSELKTITVAEGPSLSITNVENMKYYKDTCREYSTQEISDILFNGNKNEGGSYVGILMIGSYNPAIYFTVTKKIDLYAYGNYRNKYGEVSGKKAIISKLNSATGNYEEIGRYDTGTDGQKYLLAGNLEPGEYKLTSSGSSVNFDEWEYELVN